MQNISIFQERISYKGDLRLLLQQVCSDFDIGEYIFHEVITIGYEDFNIKMVTSRGKFLVKILAEYRTESEANRYEKILSEISKSDISHPKIYKSRKGYLDKFRLQNTNIRIFVFNYLEAQNLYELHHKPDNVELLCLTKQLTIINKLALKPKYYYDNWSVINFGTEYIKNKSLLPSSDRKLIDPICEEFSNLNFTKLPHCFVHGDILDTNILKDVNGKLWIIDFSVSNYYPRIHELAVFLSGPVFDPNNESQYLKRYNLVLNEYQKYQPLSEIEISTLPLYLKAAQSICIIGAIIDIRKNGMTEESNFWLETNRKGLELTSDIF